MSVSHASTATVPDAGDDHLTCFFISAMDYRVYTVTNRTVLLTGNQSLWSYDERAKINPATNFPYMDGEFNRYFKVQTTFKPIFLSQCNSHY